jgi:hypothetical protein
MQTFRLRQWDIGVMLLDVSFLSGSDFSVTYEGESNDNRKTEIKIRNIAPLSYKLADMLPML